MLLASFVVSEFTTHGTVVDVVVVLVDVVLDVDDELGFVVVDVGTTVVVVDVDVDEVVVAVPIVVGGRVSSGFFGAASTWINLPLEVTTSNCTSATSPSPLGITTERGRAMRREPNPREAAVLRL